MTIISIFFLIANFILLFVIGYYYKKSIENVSEMIEVLNDIKKNNDIESMDRDIKAITSYSLRTFKEIQENGVPEVQKMKESFQKIEEKYETIKKYIKGNRCGFKRELVCCGSFIREDFILFYIDDNINEHYIKLGEEYQKLLYKAENSVTIVDTDIVKIVSGDNVLYFKIDIFNDALVDITNIYKESEDV